MDLRAYLLNSGYWAHENGTIFPSIVSRDNIEAVQNFDVVPGRENTVFIVSYPKSGSLWLKYIVNYILMYGKPEHVKRFDHRIRGIKMLLTNLEFSSPETGEPNHTELTSALPKQQTCGTMPLVMSTYLKQNMAPSALLDSNHKIIFLARNPKDVCICHLLSVFGCDKYLQKRTDVCRYVEQFIQGTVPFGGWFGHTLSWWKVKDRDNIYTLSYEDMRKNLRGTVKKIAEFLDVPISSEYMDTIIEKCSLSDVTCNGHHNSEQADDFRESVDDGPTGVWKEYFTMSQSERFDLEFRSRFVGTGLEGIVSLS